MQKLYLDLKPISDIPNAYALSAADIAALSGENLGNLVFRHALKFIVKNLSEYKAVNNQQYHSIINQHSVESILVSCANWLGTSERDEASNLNRARIFEATKSPVICFGLGVQAKSEECLPKLGLNTIRLAKVLAERAPALSVRDEITQNTLEMSGIYNTVVTGCPSNFINGNPRLGEQIAERARKHGKSAATWNMLRSVISEASGGHVASGKVMSHQIRLMADTPSFHVVQSPALLPLLLNEGTQLPSEYESSSPFRPDVEKLRSVLRAKTLHFSSIDGWLDFSRTCDLSFGMRIHGNMVPLQAGVPSILIAHDSRTAGLAKCMGIPTISPQDFVNNCVESPSEMFLTIAQTMDQYDARRLELARIMCDYLKSNGLDIHESLVGLANIATQEI